MESKIEELKMYHVSQSFDKTKVDNIQETIVQEFHSIELDKYIKPGMNIGITVGSRGIKNIKIIIKTVIVEVKKRGGRPFIIPAMGSHGNACAEGQKNILASYDITEESMGVPILATMDVVELGTLKNGLPVYFDKYAFQSDGIIVVNRIKAHTAFKAKIESGLLKILSVGLGNHKGATTIHCLGPKHISDHVVQSAKIILENGFSNMYKLIKKGCSI